MSQDQAIREAGLLVAVDFSGLSTQQTLAALVGSLAHSKVAWLDPLDGGSLDDWLEEARGRRGEGNPVHIVGNCMASITALEFASALPGVTSVVLVEPQLATRGDVVAEYLAGVGRLGSVGDETARTLAESRSSLEDIAAHCAADLSDRSEAFAVAQGLSPSDARVFADELGVRQRRWLTYLAKAAGRELPRLGGIPVCLLGNADLSPRAARFAAVSSRVRMVVVDTEHVHASEEAAQLLRAELELADRSPRPRG